MKKSTLRYLSAAIWLILGCLQLRRSYVHWHDADRFAWGMPLLLGVAGIVTCVLMVLTAMRENATALPPGGPTA